ncbi:cytochrome c [Devosia sp.]|uniref:c-type cytochrome n=1 Tax=Devosia sp. TaxID=1871048 RepID=UPI00345C50E3
MVAARTVIISLLAGAITSGANAQEETGRAIYLERCASCHGVELEGQPDWMRRLPSGRLPAPPHDASGHTWHHSDRQLFDIVKNGLAHDRTGLRDGYARLRRRHDG